MKSNVQKAIIVGAISIVFISYPAKLSYSLSLLIDPGHSPKSIGTTACSGRPEYVYNTNLTIMIADYLRKNGITVSLTKTPDSEISLIKRCAISKEKDLFLSIHHDSVQPQFITYQSNGGFCSWKAEGFSIFISRKNHYYSKSLSYARKLGSALVKKGLQPSLHHAEKIKGEGRILLDPELGIYLYDDLIVLKNAESPAVLLEAAVIVNPKDEARAATGKYQSLIAEAVKEMVD
jgi:N-acetylmuramoyl-L-alanine amidase